MAFKEVTIENFRGIKKCTIKDLTRVNLFLGKNNSGKTSVLEAIFLITGMSNPELAIRIDNFRDLLHDDPDDFQFIFYGLDYKNSPTFEAQLESKITRTLVIRPTLKATADSIERKASSSTNLDGSQRADGLIFDFSVKAYQAQKDSQKATIRIQENQQLPTLQFQTTPPKSYKETMLGVFVSEASRENLANRLEKIFVEKRKGEIVEILQLVDPSIKDIMIGRKNMIYVDIGFDKYIPINIEGDGTNRLLNIIANLYHNKDGILFIDEIENGFHYKLLRTAWKAIMKAATRFNVQLFITTHNIEVLQQLNLSLDEPIFQGYRDEVSAYSLIKKSDHHVEAIRHSFEQFHHAIESGIELR